MKILITGANGYIGSRLLLLLLHAKHEVFAVVKNPLGLTAATADPLLKIIQADLLEEGSLSATPNDIDIAFFLVHAMSYGKDFPDMEARIARNFLSQMSKSKVKQVIYLSGLVNDTNLSPHLASRYHTECLIKDSGLPYTILRAGVIIGAGSASFEIIRDLVEKLPLMIAPKWVSNLCQPISLQDVLRYLRLVMLNSECHNQVFDIGGPDQLSYKNMLLTYAKIRNLKRYILVVPVFTPRLSSYWLYFVTSVNFSLARSLVDSLKNEAICKEHRITTIFPEPCLSYEESVRKSLDLIEQNPLIPSWKDGLMSVELESKMTQLGTVPSFGCYIDRQQYPSNKSKNEVVDKIWAIGGDNGWYYMNWAWKLRGFLDKIVGGVGLQRGRTYPHALRAGSSVDFWRVIIADKAGGHLLLYAEMKLPGEAWLEFRVKDSATGCVVTQTASFRSRGLMGSLYWYCLFPFHYLIFRGMAKAIAG